MSAKIDFIIGGSGTGKSNYLKERFADEAVKNPDKKYIMIVPEQAASTVERDMVKIMSLRHGRIGFMNIDIIGISRLAYKIFDELAVKVGGLLSDAGKSMLIRLVAGRTDLRIYKNSIDKEGFIAETKSLMSELFQYNISKEDIESLITELERTGDNTVLLEKLSDMAAIYRGFEDRLSEEDGTLPAEKTVAYLLKKLGDKKCSLLDDAVIAFDGFTGYTPSQYSLIEELAKRAVRMSFVITMDEDIIRSGRAVNDYELFYLSYVTYTKICALAEKNGQKADTLLMAENKRHMKDTMLHALERKLFRVPVKPYEGDYYQAGREGVTPGSVKNAGEDAAATGNDAELVGDIGKNSKDAAAVSEDSSETGGVGENVSVVKIVGGKEVDGKNYIRLWECRDPEEQLSCIAQEIRRKVREEGLRYRDIAVLAPNLEEMSGSFDKIFEMYDIPFFPDYTRRLRNSPFTEAIISLLNAEEKNYDYDSMFSLLKTGVMTSLDRETISLLENYAIARNVKGFRRWSRSFSYFNNNTDIYEAEEEARKKLMEPLAKVHAGFIGGGKTVGDLISAIRLFMEENHYEEKIAEASVRLEKDGDIPLSNVYSSLYENLDLFLLKMQEVLGNEKVSLREFAEIFKTGIGEIRIGTIPAVLDSVTVGDIERTRVPEVKVIFLINLNDGVVPKPGKPAKILTDNDKDRIEELFDRLGIDKTLAPNEKKSLYIEQFYLYLCMTKPTRELILSYCKMSRSGEELEKSYIISRLQGIFSRLSTEKRSPERFMGTEKTDAYFFTEMMREALYGGGLESTAIDMSGGDTAGMNGIEAEKHGGDATGCGSTGVAAGAGGYSWADAAVLYSIFRDRKRIVDTAAGYGRDDKRLSEEAVEAARRSLMSQSVSKLEEYANCEYKFFLNHLLKLEERESYSFDPLQFGNIIHSALEGLFREMDGKSLQETYDRWKNISDEEISKKMRNAIDTQFRSKSDELLAPDGTILAEGKSRFIMNSIYQLGERTARNLSRHIRGGAMSPRFYEEKFDSKDSFENSGVSIPGVAGRIKFTGKIDRADIYEDGDNVYLRIVDYKTGNNSFTYTDLLYGRQLQLTAYLSVMQEKVRILYERAGRKVNVIPVGMYYYPVSNPIITRPEDMSEEAVQKAITQELRLKGIASSEPEHLELQEKGISDPEFRKGGAANILALDFYTRKFGENEAGSVKGDHLTVSPDEFKYIESYAKLKMTELTKDMFDGHIVKDPVRSGTNTACSWCPYRDVCRFDPVNRDNRVNFIPQSKEKEAFDMIINRGGAALTGGKLE